MREINLIGQDTTCYGEDFGLKDGLAQLAGAAGADRDAAAEMGALPLRYPNKVTQKLLDTIAEHATLVKYIDMPLQHASAPVLKRMKRGASGDIFLKLIERIRRTIPGVAIRTSMIAGFPGRDRRGFRRRCASSSKPRSSTGWACSPIPTKTPAAAFALDGKVDAPHDLRTASASLMAIQRKISRAKNRTLVGREVPVLVEGPSPDSDLLWQARMSTQAPEIDGVVLINDFEGARARSPARCACCASPKRTITI